MDEFLNSSKKKIELLRELLSVLICEEDLLVKGKSQERRNVSRQRSRLNRQLRYLKNDEQLDIFLSKDDIDCLKSIQESLEKQIISQKQRNISLLKNNPSNQIEEKKQNKFNGSKTKLITIDPDSAA